MHDLDAVTAGPAAELLVAQLCGLPLHHLSLAGYRMLPGLLGSVAEALPALCELALAVEQVEGSGRLELAALPRLQDLRELELRVLPGRASVPDVTVAPLPAEASCLTCLTSLALLHVRPGQGEEGALWGSLAHLPVLQQLRFEQSGHAVRQPPAQLLQLENLTSLHVQVGRGPSSMLGARWLSTCAVRRPNPTVANHVHPHSFLPLSRLMERFMAATRLAARGPSCLSCRTGRCPAWPASSWSVWGCWACLPPGAGEAGGGTVVCWPGGCKKAAGVLWLSGHFSWDWPRSQVALQRPPPDLHTPAVHGPNLPAQPIHPPCPLSPPSRLPLRELRISGLASERALYQLALPDELTQLAATLEQLELPRCGLRALPEQAAALAALTSLDLSSNSIVRLPEMR